MLFCSREIRIKLVSVSDWLEVRQTKHRLQDQPLPVLVSLVYEGVLFVVVESRLLSMFRVSTAIPFTCLLSCSDTGYLLSLYQNHITQQ